jgi:hypothetical protein
MTLGLELYNACVTRDNCSIVEANHFLALRCTLVFTQLSCFQTQTHLLEAHVLKTHFETFDCIFPFDTRSSNDMYRNVTTTTYHPDYLF